MTKPKTYDKKIFRLWAVLNRLDTGKKVFSAELANEFDVSIRSIQRDIELLNMVGFPVMPCGKGCYKFVEGFNLGRMMLTEEDATLIAFLYDIARSLGTKFEESFKSFQNKITGGDHRSPYYLKAFDGIKLKAEYPFADTLTEAVSGNTCLRLSYASGKGKGEVKEYECQPLKIIFYEGFWYLLAKCGNETIMRKFRLDKMKEVKPVDKSFKIPDNLKRILDESVNVWFDGDRNMKVTLEVSQEVAEFFKKRNYFPKQRIVKERANGDIVIESLVSCDMEIIPTILSWIPWVKVVAPIEIKEKIEERIRAYLRK
ncbi:MAG: WYL domain-containing protein [Candidatus Omnitrophica bacterium]|nr:WYL domain-containing protein [Candidatus Omnitrophota bacterium]